MKAFDLGLLVPKGSRVLGHGWEAGTVVAGMALE